MKKFFSVLWEMLDLNSKVDNLTRSIELMATKEELIGLAGNLNAAIANESAEVQTVIGEKVSEAVAPLLKQVAELSAQLANGAAPNGVVFTQEEVDAIAAQLGAALNSISAVVTPTPVVDPVPAPEVPVDPARLILHRS